MPYRVCFIEETTTEWFIIDTILDALFAMDIIVNFNSAFIDDEGNLVTKRKQITINYLKSWFTLDLIACIPF